MWGCGCDDGHGVVVCLTDIWAVDEGHGVVVWWWTDMCEDELCACVWLLLLEW